jgi:hypothetical protein
VLLLLDQLCVMIKHESDVSRFFVRFSMILEPHDNRGVQTGGFSLGFGCDVFVLKLDGKLGFGLNSPGEK